jgi:GNAT superfamily N-acetyltransferase
MTLAVLFHAAETVVRPATRDDAPALARFCRENPGYDLFLSGAAPVEAEWVEDFLTDLPPADFGWSATHKLIATPLDRPDTIHAVMDVSEDMLARGVGHIGLFQVAENLHGTGFADELYRALEAWMVARGMDAIRLGVFLGNDRGAAFWGRHGYRLSRLRAAPDGSGHVSQVLMKAFSPTSLEAWHARVPRDHPDAP